MPYRRSRRRRHKRVFRGSIRRKYRGRKKVGLGTSLRRSLRYSQQPEAVSVPVGGTSVIAWRANGMFDPDTRAGGHQPRTFDQLMTMYDHFVVLASKIRVWVQSTSTNGIIFGITIRDNSAADTVEDYLEDPHTVFKVTDPTAPGPQFINMRTSVAKFLGRKVMGDPDLKGSDSSSPTEQVHFHFWQAHLDSSEAASTSYVQTSIDYDAVFIEPTIPPQS